MASAALVTISAAWCAVTAGFRSMYAARAAASSRAASVTVKSDRDVHPVGQRLVTCDHL
jgi:hypothetical protein